jgi:hypothetical protein
MNEMISTPDGSPPSANGRGLPPWVSRELAGLDRAVLLIIFLEQFYLSISSFWVAAIMPDKGGTYSFEILFGLWGLVSAFGLGFTGLRSRLFALLWHATFFGSIFVRFMNSSSPSASNARQWVLYDSLAILYLAVTAFLQYRRRKKLNQGVHLSN